LKPGQGKAYLANLSKDQMVRLKLQAERQSVHFSFYPPTSKSAALLEDSTEKEWSGKLTESGLYEIVIVSSGTESANYSLDLSAEDVVTKGEN
jgi:serine/threonine-protein kinase